MSKIVSFFFFFFLRLRIKGNNEYDEYENKGGQLVGFLEKLKEYIKNGNPKLSIPVLDPLQIKNMSIDLNEKGLIS